ncbi:hypothetical protein OMP38_16195 [Cohnella ginsengisoli]|uniref:Lipoprotein n=1 Tax=Cohnella ginsengisoli TaxID=425004 RepID=A0A9X4KIP7_9BACL|nr:hypothetical protein [Cohnella ginsengisoli]MDG0792234.1 hypothetical protein [Cohnella ginsengisoli]
MKLKTICAFLLTFCFVVLVSGCGKSNDNETGTETEINHLFLIKPGDLSKATIMLGDGTLSKELSEKSDIEELTKYLDEAKIAEGSATADKPRLISLHKNDGTVISIELTGTGTIFIDKNTNIAYTTNKQDVPFLTWIENKEKQ